MKGFHASGDLFDGPIVHIAARRAAWTAGAATGAVGLLAGLLAGWIMFRRRGRGPVVGATPASPAA